MRQTTQIIEKIGKLLTDRIDQANICCLRLADTLETVDLANIHENSRNTELKQLLNKLHDVFKR